MMAFTAPLTEADAPVASIPAERRGLRRDAVRLMIADIAAGTIRHTTFAALGSALRAGDALVVNVSATIPAALDGVTADGGPMRLHLSSPIAGGLWSTEPRRPAGPGSVPWRDFPGGTVTLPGGANAELLARDVRSPRLWVTTIRGVGDLAEYLRRHGLPIRYAHSGGAWPLSDHQTVYATEPGSVEMPSAGRPFTPELITSLVTAGVLVAPVVLHSGVASFEEGERPDAERYRVPETTARLLNHVRQTGARVVAVGTTSVRAIESVVDSAGAIHPGRGVTDLVVTPERGVRGVDGIITGWHESGASHLDLIAAIGGAELVEACYREAHRLGYAWHEFGDSLLLL